MIRTVVDRYYSRVYIISVPRLMSEKQFMDRARVRPQSYAGRIAARLYSDIFTKSLEIKHDFDAYYKVEYGAFADYLRKRYLLPREVADEIAAVYDKSAAIFRYKYPLSFIEDDPGEAMLGVLLDTEVNQ